MQVKNALSASLMRQSDILSGESLSIESIVWHAVCQDNYLEFQFNPYRPCAPNQMKNPGQSRALEIDEWKNQIYVFLEQVFSTSEIDLGICGSRIRAPV
jgi:hypothetical protein